MTSHTRTRRSCYLLAFLFGLLFSSAVTQAQQINPVSQVNWPATTGSGAPTQFCPSSVTGSTTNNSPVVALSSATGIFPGQAVTGSGIPASTTVLSLFGLNATLSANATATASGVSLSFSSYGMPYTDVVGNTSYVCTSVGWAINGGSGANPVSGQVVNTIPLNTNGTSTAINAASALSQTGSGSGSIVTDAGNFDGVSAAFSGTVAALTANLGIINGTALQNIPYDAWGDSITYGYLSSTWANSYTALTGAARDYTYVQTCAGSAGCDHGVAGDDLEDLSNHLEQWTQPETIISQMIGQNDGCGGGSRGYNYWQNMYEGSVAWHMTPTKIAATGATVGAGTWTSPGAGYYAGAQQATSGNLVFSNVFGSVVYVWLESTYTSTSTVNVTTEQGTLAQQTSVSLGQAWTSQEGFTHGMTLVRIPMLNSGLHTVTVTVVTYDGTHPIIVNAVAGNEGQSTASGPFGFFMYNTPTLGMGSTAAGGTPQTASTFSITSNVATILAPGTYTVGQWVYLSGFTNTFLNTSTQATGATQITGLVSGGFTFALTHANASGSDAGSVYPYANYTEFYLPTCRESINRSVGAIASDGLVARVVNTDSVCYANPTGVQPTFPTSLLCIGGDNMTHPNNAGHALIASALKSRMANFLWQADIGGSLNGSKPRFTDGSQQMVCGNYALTANTTGTCDIFSKIANAGLHTAPTGFTTQDIGTEEPQHVLTGPNPSSTFRNVGSGADQEQLQRWSIPVGSGPTAQSVTVTATFNSGDSYLSGYNCDLTLTETQPFRIEQRYTVTGSNGGTAISLGQVWSAYKSGSISPLFLANPTVVGSTTGFTVDIANTDTSATAYGTLKYECTNFNNIQIATGGFANSAAFTTVATAPSVWPTGLDSIAQPANEVLAGPASGSAALPAYRALVPADIPSHMPLYGYCSGAASSNQTVLGLAGLGGLGSGCANLRTAAPPIMRNAGVVDHLSVSCALTGVNAASGVFTVYDNSGGVTTLTPVTVTYGTTTINTIVSDTTHSYAFAAGDRIGVSFSTYSSGETLGNCGATIWVTGQ